LKTLILFDMRFLILNMDYLDFLVWLYGQNQGLECMPFKEQMRVRIESLYGLADFYSRNLRKLGHEAFDVYTNNEPMQKTWGREHGLKNEEPCIPIQKRTSYLQKVRQAVSGTMLRNLKPMFRFLINRLDKPPPWFYDTLTAQIKHYKPDVLINHTLYGISCQFLREIKQHVGLLVGQHPAMPLSDHKDYSCYDLVISSFPPTIDYLRRRNIATAFLRLGFEEQVLDSLKTEGETIDISFVGSFFKAHSSRVLLLEELSRRFERLNIWGRPVEELEKKSPIHDNLMGQAWGIQMYQILRNSKITLNHHGSIPPYANNCRLYEATGAGTLLITDWKPDLEELFEPGREVIAYRNIDECAELIQYYLEHEDERKTVACAGHQRTLREHTYLQRMEELAEIVQKHF
jgi:spore maturation protein CgeB